MFGAKYKLLTLLGFEVKVDASWILLALLVTWSFAQGVFPHEAPGLTSVTYWSMGVFGAIGLFASIILHELAHSVVARKFGLEMKGITLFIFGGVAEMADDPPSARAEFYMAIAGPIASLAIAILCKASAVVTNSFAPMAVVFAHLALINTALAVFNMVPAFPLDGGRALRAYLWGRHKDMAKATYTAAKLGEFFGIALIGLGLVLLIGGAGLGAIWWGLIGLFLNSIARAEITRMKMQDILGGLKVSDLMTPNVETVPRDVTIREFIESHIYQSFHDMYPVTDEGQICGAVTVRGLKQVPQDLWDTTLVETALVKITPDNAIKPGSTAVEALKKLQKTGASRLLVLDGQLLVGIIVLKDLLKPLNIHSILDQN